MVVYNLKILLILLIKLFMFYHNWALAFKAYYHCCVFVYSWLYWSMQWWQTAFWKEVFKCIFFFKYALLRVHKGTTRNPFHKQTTHYPLWCHVVTYMWGNIGSIKRVLGYPPESNFTRSGHEFNLWHAFGDYTYKITSPRGQWVNLLYNRSKLLALFGIFWASHWGQVTHICVSILTTIGSDNGLSPGQWQAIIWTNAGILLLGLLGTNFSEILIQIHAFSVRKMHWKKIKMSSA